MNNNNDNNDINNNNIKNNYNSAQNVSLKISPRWSSYIINSVNKTKLFWLIQSLASIRAKENLLTRTARVYVKMYVKKKVVNVHSIHQKSLKYSLNIHFQNCANNWHSHIL